MNLTRRQSIWYIADHVRSILKLSTPPFNPEELINRLGGNIKYLSLEDAEKEGYNANFEAALQTSSTSNDDPDSVEFTVIVADWKNKQRIRFSIAHEIGHLVLHLLVPGGKIKPSQITYRNLQSCEHNAVSHNGKINIEEIAKVFDVSSSAATVRGSILSLW